MGLMGRIGPMGLIGAMEVGGKVKNPSGVSSKCNNERLGKPQRGVVSNPAFYFQGTLP